MVEICEKRVRMMVNWVLAVCAVLLLLMANTCRVQAYEHTFVCVLLIEN